MILFLRSEEHELSPVDSMSNDRDAHRRKRGSGTKVGGAAASAKSATKNSGGNKKNFRLYSEQAVITSFSIWVIGLLTWQFHFFRQISERRKRDSGLSAADVRALLSMWEAQERRKQEYANQWAADHYYGRANPEEDQPEVDENGDIWYNEPVVIAPRERDFPHHSYFSEQNRTPLPVNHAYPDMYAVGPNPNELAQRYEEARRKRQYANKMKRFMVARKRSDALTQASYRPHVDLYTLAELLRSAPQVQEQDIPVYRRLIL